MTREEERKQRIDKAVEASKKKFPSIDQISPSIWCIQAGDYIIYTSRKGIEEFDKVLKEKAKEYGLERKNSI